MYRDLKKEDLLKLNIKVFIDGEDVTNMSTAELNEKYNNKDYTDNYTRFEVFQYSKKFKRWFYKKPKEYTRYHEKGINKYCTYYNIGLTMQGSGRGICFHRFVYAWFNDIVPVYNEQGELLDICHNDHDTANNNIKNLRLDTRKNNLAERTGATNQYGKPRRIEE